MKITINPYDPKSIDKAIKQLQEYKKDFLAKEQIFIKRLAEIGVSVATSLYEIADYDGDKDVVVEIVNISDTKKAVKASGKTVGFIEFGTGVKYPEWDSSGMQYTPPEHGTYGKGHGANPKGWWFNGGGGYYDPAKDKSGNLATHTYGNPPAEAMLTARNTMIEQVVQIAREVWR
jgi:hypothetical protein